MSSVNGQRVEKTSGWLTHALGQRLMLTKSILSLFDQALVSGTRFITTILVARYCGVDELGRYSLAMSIFLLTFGIQQALVFGPYTIFRNQSEKNQSSCYSGNVFILFGVLCLPLMMIVVLSGGMIALFSSDSSIGTIMIMLGLVLPFLLIREFVRQRSFADLNMPNILAVDGITTVIQLGLLAGLLWYSVLDTTTAISAAAIAAFIGGASVLFPSRKQLTCRFREIYHDAVCHWKFGRWSLASQIADMLTWHLLHWIILFTLGIKATGLFAACLTIIALANPVILAVNNVLAPRSAAVYDGGGVKRLSQMIRSTTLVMAAIIAIFCVMILIFGKTLLTFTYGSVEFSNGFMALFILSLSMLSEVIGDTPHHALRAMNRPDVSFRASFIGLSAMLLTAFPMIGLWNVAGAAIALLIGSTTTCILRWVSYRNLLRHDSQGGSPA